MDGVYPTSTCFKQPYNCNGSYTGGTWASTAFIRGRGQVTFPTEIYDEGWPEYLVNNTPATPIYIRVAPSQYTGKPVFWINGWERPRLILTKGKKYHLNVVTCGHPFSFCKKKNYISKEAIGVNGDYFVTTITIDDSFPQEFYYTCTNHMDMGGNVVLKK